MKNYTIAIVGDAYVGKSAFITRLVYGEFSPVYTPTHGMSINSMPLYTTDGYATFQLLELSCDPANIMYALPSADAAIIIFDCTNQHSYNNVHDWHHGCSKITDNIMICGNKLDVISLAFDPPDIKNIYYYDISVKDNTIQEPFRVLLSKLIGTEQKMNNNDTSQDSSWDNDMCSLGDEHDPFWDNDIHSLDEAHDLLSRDISYSNKFFDAFFNEALEA